MSMHHRLRFSRHRQIASVMLFVWLFAVFVSWANACLVQPSAATVHGRGHHELGGGVHDAAAAAHDAAAGIDATDQPDSAKDACASFCEAEQSIVAKPQPSKGDGAADGAALPACAFEGWPAFLPGRAEARWRPIAAPLPPGPPVAIAFLRLTL
jgi:hypothetical protein